MRAVKRDILLEFGLIDEPLSRIYIEEIANKKLVRYKDIIHDTGPKKGESLFTHVINGVFLIERLRDILSISDIEAKVLFTAYTVHDINKLPEYDGQRYNLIATKENFIKELGNLEMELFFPEYGDYLDDITTLTRAHSGHYHSDGESLKKSYNPYKLGKGRIDQLKHIIRAADIIDLSQELEERSEKNLFLSEINIFSNTQLTFCHHKLTEHRGILTNIIHNEIVSYLENELGLLPLLFYPNGVAYLVEKNRKLSLSKDDLGNIGEKVVERVADMTRENYTDFINPASTGIKIDPKCLSLNIPLKKIFKEVYNIISRRKFGIDYMEEGCKKRTLRNIEKLRKKVKDETLRVQLDNVEREISSSSSLLPKDEDKLRMGEFLKTYYIFTNDNYFNKDVEQSWKYIYNLLSIDEDKISALEYFDARYDRAFLVVKDLDSDFEDLHKVIIEDSQQLFGETSPEKDDQFGALKEYVKNYTDFSFAFEREVDFTQYLQNYTRNNHKQCCYCGSEFPTDEWMSADVPQNIKVQNFSNRLLGGKGEPKRNICDICKIQFLVEKLNYNALSNTKTVYLHLYPYSFHPDIFLKALNNELKNIVAQDISAILLNTEVSLREFVSENRVNLHYSSTKINGNPLPKFADILGNNFIFPLNCVGNNDSERFLFALENALFLQKYFGCKVLLTDSAVPILAKQEFNDVFIDNIPASFRGLLRANDLSESELGEVWRKIKILYSLKNIVYNPKSKRNEFLTLIQNLIGDELQIYYVVDRLLENKLRNIRDQSRKEGLDLYLSQELIALINDLTKGGKKVQELKTLAQIAWDARIKGESLKRNSLLRPLDMILDKLSHRSEMLDLEVIKAALVEDIFAHLERIASEQYKPGATKRERIKQFVDQFFTGVLDKGFKGDINKLLANEKTIRSAYLFYVKEQIGSKKKEV